MIAVSDPNQALLLKRIGK